MDSTALLKPLLAGEGVLARRKPSSDELADIDYGRKIANALAGFDIGQSVVMADRACVALEAMEGTDATLRRAATLANGTAAAPGEGVAAQAAPAVRRARWWVPPPSAS